MLRPFVLMAVACLALVLPPASAAAPPRVPAEWEPHAATWMQWPGPWEPALRPAFARIINLVQQYEPVHLLVSNSHEKATATQFLRAHGVAFGSLTLHIVPIDNAWMRDNGPMYVTEHEETWIQNWKFDAWGGNFGHEVSHFYDNRIPVFVATHLGLRHEDFQDYVLEKGNLEVNGEGVALLNWDCQAQRNPDLARAKHEAILTARLGLDQIIWAYGHDPDDLTTGHIDGIARFVNATTVAIADTGAPTELNLATACKHAGFTVEWYPGDVNWLVGNGFVLGAASGDTTLDARNKALLQAWFPERDIHLIDITAIQEGGGGIHCVTNDQPRLATK